MGRKKINKKSSIARSKGIPRFGYDYYGLSKQRVRELQNGCQTGKYSLEMLQEACKEFELIAPWIILSVTKNKSYDALKRKWELKEIEQMPYCRTDFYGFRRKFYHNLNVILREECSA